MERIRSRKCLSEKERERERERERKGGFVSERA
jgi:hypothetical protein